MIFLNFFRGQQQPPPQASAAPPPASAAAPPASAAPPPASAARHQPSLVPHRDDEDECDYVYMLSQRGSKKNRTLGDYIDTIEFDKKYNPGNQGKCEKQQM